VHWDPGTAQRVLHLYIRLAHLKLGRTRSSCRTLSALPWEVFLEQRGGLYSVLMGPVAGWGMLPPRSRGFQGCLGLCVIPTVTPLRLHCLRHGAFGFRGCCGLTVGFATECYGHLPRPHENLAAAV
jgi:hypothetical protein